MYSAIWAGGGVLVVGGEVAGVLVCTDGAGREPVVTGSAGVADPSVLGVQPPSSRVQPVTASRTGVNLMRDMVGGVATPPDAPTLVR